MAPAADPSAPTPASWLPDPVPPLHAPPSGSRRTGPPDTSLRSPGEAADGCSISASTQPVPGHSRSSRTGPAPGTPPRSSSRTARSFPASSDDAAHFEYDGYGPSPVPSGTAICPARPHTACRCRSASPWADRNPPRPDDILPTRSPLSGIETPPVQSDTANSRQ